jgi:four helix bundle protein
LFGIRLKGPYQNQFQRAALSIALNLSEGNVKTSAKERRQFFERALGSCRECQTIADIVGLESVKLQLDRIAANCYCLCRSLSKC